MGLSYNQMYLDHSKAGYRTGGFAGFWGSVFRGVYRTALPTWLGVPVQVP